MSHELPPLQSMTLAEHEQRDKRFAAIHEAGHLTVCLALGVRARAHIEPTGVCNLDKKAWIGSTQSVDSPVIPLAVRLAGAMAEWMNEDEVFDEELWLDTLTIDPSDAGVSPTDGDGVDFSDYKGLRAATRKAFAVLTRHRRFFEWAVDDLIAWEVIPDGWAWDHFERLEPARAVRKARALGPKVRTGK